MNAGVQRNSNLQERIEALQSESSLLKTQLQSAKQQLSFLKESEKASGERYLTELSVANEAALVAVARAEVAETRGREASKKEVAFAEEKNFLKERQAELEESVASIRERLNEAIQERWLSEEKLNKIIQAQERKAASGGMTGMTAEDQEKETRELRRHVQDLEGEAKRARRETQKTKEKLGGLILQNKARDEESLKLNGVMRDLSQKLLTLERDLAISEQANDDYEALVASMRAQ